MLKSRSQSGRRFSGVCVQNVVTTRNSLSGWTRGSLEVYGQRISREQMNRSRRLEIGGWAPRHPSMLSIGCALGVDADHKTSRRSTISRLQVDDLLVANVPVRKHPATRV